MPTTDGHEKNKTPPASQTPSEVRGARRDRFTPREGSPLETLEKRRCVLPPPSSIKYFVAMKYLVAYTTCIQINLVDIF
ncbi:UNVERIFIED_CONTAM: hypothetical protein NCL1_52087 [Trichonephila clavipes]